MNQFEKASRLKLRFDTAKGSLTVEDLWDTPLLSRANGLSLDTVARTLARSLKDTDTESFVVKTSKADEILQLKFDIVKHVIDTKLAEAEAAKTRAENHDKKGRIKEIIARKQNSKLEEMSEEELTAMVGAL